MADYSRPRQTKADQGQSILISAVLPASLMPLFSSSKVRKVQKKRHTPADPVPLPPKINKNKRGKKPTATEVHQVLMTSCSRLSVNAIVLGKSSAYCEALFSASLLRASPV